MVPIDVEALRAMDYLRSTPDEMARGHGRIPLLRIWSY